MKKLTSLSIFFFSGYIFIIKFLTWCSMLHIYIFVNVRSLIKLTENKFVHLNYCYQEGRVEIRVKRAGLRSQSRGLGQGWDSSKRFNPATFLCLSQARTLISSVMCPGHFCIQWARWEVIVLFVDIDGIIDHHCLNFLFIMISIIHNDTTAY